MSESSSFPLCIGLPREQQKAIQVFLKNRHQLINLQQNTQNVDKDKALLHTNFIAASLKKFDQTQLPREDAWIWTQSNARAKVTLDASTTITIRKLNPRRRDTSTEKPPSFKIWLYEVDSVTNVPWYFLWCEKGRRELDGIDTDIGFIFPQYLSILDFSFLHPYVDYEVAKEFGWL